MDESSVLALRRTAKLPCLAAGLAIPMLHPCLSFSYQEGGKQVSTQR